MKKTMLILWIGLLLCMGIGCQKQDDKAADTLSVVAAGYAEYDWICHILGDEAENAEVRMLLDDGVDLHSFQPAVEDMVAIAEADLFVYVSAVEDSWVEDALKNTSNPRQVAINLVDVLGNGVKENEHDHHGEHDHEEGHQHEEAAVDEHVWLSVKNAMLFCEHIAGVLSELQPDMAAVYQENLESYLKQLQELDAEYQTVVDRSQRQVMIFCDRYPFRYLLEDYGIEAYAAFSGCTADAEASFETVAFLSDKVAELDVSGVVMIEGSERELAETVLANAGSSAEILTMHSMQSVTAEAAGTMSYLDVMKENLKVLETALN